MAREPELQSQQNQQTRQNQQGEHGSQTQQSSSGQRAGTASDQQRDIATTRENTSGTPTAQRTGGSTGVTRDQQRSSPAYGSRGATSDPFALMQRMSQDMDRLFEQFGFGTALGTPLGGTSLGSSSLGSGIWAPQIESFRRGDELVIRADVPGVRKEDLHVEVEDGVLSLSGERRSDNEENRDGYYRSERSYGQFQRTIPLPEGVDADQCHASFNDGVLEVTLPAPKEEQRKPKRIEIR